MTNADKYLKDGVNVEEFAKVIESYYYNSPFESELEAVESFLKAPVQPTLTKDEKVILRNIKNTCKTIYREKYTGQIRTTFHCPHPDGLCGEELRCFKDLFQFIKERRRIPDRGTIERRMKWNEK